MTVIFQENIEIAKPAFLGGERRWSLSNLKPINVLLGKNGSGKSLLLRSWRDADVNGSHYIIPERVGNIGFQSNYIEREIDGQSRKGSSQANFNTNYRQLVIARIQTYFMKRGSVREGALPGKIEDLESLMDLLLPDFTVKLQSKQPPYALSRIADSTAITDITQLSTGEAQLFTLGLDILTISAMWDIDQAEKRIILIDEPDAHIHPDLQVRFADFICHIADKYQVQFVISTHSTTLLSAIGRFSPTNSGIIYLNKTDSAFEVKPFDASLQEITACLGGQVLSD